MYLLKRKILHLDRQKSAHVLLPITKYGPP